MPKPTNMPSASFCVLREPDEERIVSVSSGILMAKVRNFLIDVLAELTLDGFYLFRPQEAKLEKKQNCPLFGQKLYFPSRESLRLRSNAKRHIYITNRIVMRSYARQFTGWYVLCVQTWTNVEKGRQNNALPG